MIVAECGLHVFDAFWDVVRKEEDECASSEDFRRFRLYAQRVAIRRER